MSSRVNQYKKEQEDLQRLETSYAELAADATLAAAGWLPPPWGTAADIASLGKSLYKGDWGGALFDAIGLIPIAGDAAKAGKLGNRLKDIENAISVAKSGLARRFMGLIADQKAAAKKYWNDIVTQGRKAFDEAIKKCSTQECKEELVSLIGPQYKYAPKSGGKWVNGLRGDGLFKPDPNSDLGKALAAYNAKTGKNLDGIPYKDGFPNFDEFVVKTGGTKAEVEILQAGNHTSDFADADKALLAATGKTRKDLERELGTDLTWHHKEDGVTMQLVPKNLHGASNGSGHMGGASLAKQEEF